MNNRNKQYLARWLAITVILGMAGAMFASPSRATGASDDNQPTVKTFFANGAPADDSPLLAGSPPSDPANSAEIRQEAHIVLGQPVPQNNTPKDNSVVPPPQEKLVPTDDILNTSSEEDKSGILPNTTTQMIGDDFQGGPQQKIFSANALPAEQLPLAGGPSSDPVNSGEIRQEAHIVLGQPALQNNTPKANSVVPPLQEKQVPTADMLNTSSEEDKSGVLPGGAPSTGPQPLPAGWSSLITETFEGSFPTGLWSTYDGNGTSNGQFYWDDDDYLPYTGSWSAWPASGGANGLDPALYYYPNNVNSWMEYGPVNLSGYTDAELLFYYWNQSELNYDNFWWLVSTDNLNYYGYSVSGNSGGWHYVNFDLTAVPVLGNVTGDSSVWIALLFTSDSSNVYDGAFVDNIVLQAYQAGGGPGGWILESSETSNKGGTMNTTGAQLYVGDNAQDKQYKSFLSFSTADLPDNAVITKVQLKFNVQGFAGGNMFTPTKTLGNLLMDIRKPYFGPNANLAVGDFQAVANVDSVGTLGSIPGIGWRTVTLKSTAYPFINLKGTTQFRLRLQKDDNNDLGADYLKIYSANAPAVNRPQLIIQYNAP